MKIATGLRPRAELRRAPRTFPQRFEFNGGDLSLQVPDSLGVDVWIVLFETEEDTATRRGGISRGLLVLDAEPVIQKRGFAVTLRKGDPERNAETIAEARKRYGAPEDAAVVDVPWEFPQITERRISWWEVTA